ncbi:MAG: Ger(x)C family spore germination protein [Paenibacillaceae bacterium]|nr:Ger(x)C family spore germination protein [Paenibacillaceae bacterium]
MKRTATLLGVVLALLPVSGCWDKSELPEKGYIMGVGIDSAGQGIYRLTTEVYKPSQKAASNGKQGESYVNIVTEDDTLFEAIRDISIHLGRKAQFSHMRLIMISEPLAREQKLGDLLDVFYRDHEPRLNALLMIARGETGPYLLAKPKIESTISQQMASIDRSSKRHSAKSVKGSLLSFARQTKNPTGIALLPYFYRDAKGDLVSSGSAVLKDGMLREVWTSAAVEPLLMLRNEYENGIVEVPCPEEGGGDSGKSKETIEVTRVATKLRFALRGDALAVTIRSIVQGSIGDLGCSRIETPEEEAAFVARAQQELIREMNEVIAKMKASQLDVIGLGNRLYRKHPAIWKSWKDDWGSRFAASTFDVQATIDILHTGTEIGHPNDVK